MALSQFNQQQQPAAAAVNNEQTFSETITLTTVDENHAQCGAENQVAINQRRKRLGDVGGTLAANLLGTAVLAAIVTMRHFIDYNYWNIVTSALIAGFCGSLTTLSSMTAEIWEMTDRDAVVYIAVSLLSGQILLITITGIPQWI
jgi:fluoride ion exporter CrcB/FEX